MNIVAIIQARMGSTRLPGKVLAEIAGRPMLARVIDRVQAAATIGSVVVATSTEPTDDPVAACAAKCGVAVFRGDEQNVLRRYADAAAAASADVVVRVTADCPLIDPAVIDAVAQALIGANPRRSFAANTLTRTFPRGLDVEAMWRDDLVRLDALATAAYHRAHVFPFAYEHPELFPAVSVTNDRDYSALRWTVDTAEDLELVRRIVSALPADRTSWHDTLAIVEAHPEWAAINQHVVQKPASAL